MRFRLTVDGEDHEIEVARRREGVEVHVDGAPYHARVGRHGGAFVVRIGGRSHRIVFQGTSVLVDGAPHEVIAESEDEAAGDAGRARTSGPRVFELRPPMPGRLVKLPIAPGDRVRRGQPLAVLEAMKMQNEIPAPADGVVVEVRAKEGETIAADRVIAVLESSPGSEP